MTKEKESTNKNNELSNLRDDINSIDTDIIKLLTKRRNVSKEVVQFKESSVIPVRNKEREKEILNKLIEEGKKSGLDSHYITTIFNTILADSVRVQHTHIQDKLNPNSNLDIARVAFTGIEGSRGHVAACQHMDRKGVEGAYVSCKSFNQLFDLLESGKAEYALLPVENTISGGINEAYDFLLQRRPSIIGEEKLRTTHSCFAMSPITAGDIKIIYATPDDLQQCSSFIDKLGDVEIRYVRYSAQAIENLKKDKSKNTAAIGFLSASLTEGLEVVSDEIANHRESFTRFLVISRKPVEVDPQIPSKTSLVIATGQEPGALVNALLVFQEYGVQMSKLESRPLLGNPWEEMFYVDIDGNVKEERIIAALNDVTKRVRFIKVLGSYPKDGIDAAKLGPNSEAVSNKTKKKEIATAKAPSIKTDSKSESYRLGSRAYKAEDTVIDVKGVKIGGDNFLVIAGPCSVESEGQINDCAKHAQEQGVQILRGGCFKPRTSPYSFQGLGYKGLEFLVNAGKHYGLPVVTEVLAPEDVQKVSETADILQVGARNMQNFTLLNEVGKTSRPVMLKRGMSASILELLQAAEYILNQGNQQVFLCERGIRTFETATRNTLDLSAVPVLRSKTHLPVIVDPSHAAGERDLVIPLVLAAKAVGAHGVMVEFHPEPAKALSDGPQALLYSQLEDMMQQIA